MGVVAGVGGGALGYLLGGQAMTHPSETKIESQASEDHPPLHPASTSETDASVDHNSPGHGDKKAHESPAPGTHSKQEATTSHPPSHQTPSRLIVRELSPIVTNLAEPANNWIRLQSAIVFNPDDLPHPEKTIAELTSDITGYLRTVSLSSLEGADGLRRLQEELSERATIRSNGKIHEFIVETMVVQ